MGPQSEGDVASEEGYFFKGGRFAIYNVMGMI